MKFRNSDERTEVYETWILEALEELGGRAEKLDVMKAIWKEHSIEIMNSGDDFFRWQNDISWAATSCRKYNYLKQANDSRKGFWEIDPDFDWYKYIPCLWERENPI